MDKNYQKNLVLNYLRNNSSITSVEAWKAFGITRLSAVVFVLRKAGYNIVTLMIEGSNRYGRSCRYAKYVLREDNDESVSD